MSNPEKFVLLGIAGILIYRWMAGAPPANGATPCITSDYYPPWLVQLSETLTQSNYFYDPACR